LSVTEFPGFENDGSGKCHYNAKDVAVNITGFKYGKSTIGCHVQLFFCMFTYVLFEIFMLVAGTTGGNENLMQVIPV
jgi:hypothetical protein